MNIFINIRELLISLYIYVVSNIIEKESNNMQDNDTQFDKELESLWNDMQSMDRQELEAYTERLYISLYDLKYKQIVKEKEERDWAHRAAFANPF